MAFRKTRILILCKTYPSPSAKHAETSCVAGMDDQGNLIRLYPVPFRLIGDEAQFKKWQWITARIEKSRNDHRPESHRIAVDTITCDETPLSTRNGWHDRKVWIEKAHKFGDFEQLEATRIDSGATLGVVCPAKVIGLDITPANPPDWTDEERKKLIQLQQQGNFFDAADAKSIAMLKKLPFEFHYRYECLGRNGPVEYRHKIVDWEIGALYWNVRRSQGGNWESALRAKFEDEFSTKDLMFLMGTIHRFPNQWLIISLIYPPKTPPDQLRQGSLF